MVPRHSLIARKLNSRLNRDPNRSLATRAYCQNAGPDGFFRRSLVSSPALHRAGVVVAGEFFRRFADRTEQAVNEIVLGLDEIELRTKTNVERDVVVPNHVTDVMESSGTRFDRSFVFLTPDRHTFRDADWLMERWSRAHKATGIRKRTKPYPWRSTYVAIALPKVPRNY